MAVMVVKVSRTVRGQCATPYSIRRDVFEAGMGRYCSKSCSEPQWAARCRSLSAFWALVGPADENGCRDWQGARDKMGTASSRCLVAVSSRWHTAPPMN
jgi:hypothetical protein